MSNNKMRLLVLTHGGIEHALRQLIALDCAEIVGVFIETDTLRRVGRLEKLKRSVRYDGYVETLFKSARKLLASGRRAESSEGAPAGHRILEELASAAGVPLHYVSNYHDADAIKLMRETCPDLGLLLGTNIVKESVFKIPRLGSINVHQGLAPYYRGCPAVFWELFNDEREVGLTIHFVESKVDTGDIILQETVPLDYDYAYGLDFEAFIESYRRRLSSRCAQLLAQAVRALAEGSAAARSQDLTIGKRYRLPIKSEKDELRRRLRARRHRLTEPLMNRHTAGGH